MTREEHTENIGLDWGGVPSHAHRSRAAATILEIHHSRDLLGAVSVVHEQLLSQAFMHIVRPALAAAPAMVVGQAGGSGERGLLRRSKGHVQSRQVRLRQRRRHIVGILRDDGHGGVAWQLAGLIGVIRNVHGRTTGTLEILPVWPTIDKIDVRRFVPQLHPGPVADIRVLLGEIVVLGSRTGGSRSGVVRGSGGLAPREE